MAAAEGFFWVVWIEVLLVFAVVEEGSGGGEVGGVYCWGGEREKGFVVCL